MRQFIYILFLWSSISLACEPNETHVREQWIKPYTRSDGTKVLGHIRSEHCRVISVHNYFQDTGSEIKGFKGKFKAWTQSEKALVQSKLDELPSWLKKYKIASILRASSHPGNPKNPALTIPASKTIILFDVFFKSSKVKDVLLHELAHIAIWDLDPVQLHQFFISNGWTYQKGNRPTPPTKVILPDSAHSPSEDFANTLEVYYSNPKLLKEFNLKSFSILEEIIKSKDNR